MSWDVLVHASEYPPPKMSEMPADWQPVPLGSCEKVRLLLLKAAPDTNWSEPSWGRLVRETFSIEINLGDSEPCLSFMLHVRGGRDALPIVQAFSAGQGWFAIDTTMNEWMHHCEDIGEGQDRFNNFLNFVKEQHRPKGMLARFRAFIKR